MTDQELKDIVAAVVAELEKSGVDFDYKAEPAKDGDLVFVIRGTAPNYQGVTVTWKGLLDIITSQATQAKNDAVTAKNAADKILERVQSNGTAISNFVATSKTEIETQKNESVNAVKSVYQTDLNELKGDLDNLRNGEILIDLLDRNWNDNIGMDSFGAYVSNSNARYYGDGEVDVSRYVGETIHFVIDNTDTTSCTYSFLNIDGYNIERTTIKESTDVIIPNNAKTFRLCAVASDVSKLKNSKSSIQAYIIINGISYDEAQKLLSDIPNINNDIKNIKSEVSPTIVETVTMINAIVNGISGKVQTSNIALLSKDYFDVDVFEKFTVDPNNNVVIYQYAEDYSYIGPARFGELEYLNTTGDVITKKDITFSDGTKFFLLQVKNDRLSPTEITPNDVNITIEYINHKIAELEKEVSTTRYIASPNYSYALNKILCIGDSLTSGAYYGTTVPWSGNVGTSIKQNYPSILGRMLGCETINGGTSGINSTNWYKQKYETIIDDTEQDENKWFDSVIIWLGTNGGYTDTFATDVQPYGTNYEQYADTAVGNLCKIIQRIKTHHPNRFMAICNLYTEPNTSKASNKVISEVAEYYGLLLIDMSDLTYENYPNLHYGMKFIGSDGLMHSNPHFNKAGNIFIADRIARRINEYLSENLLSCDFGLKVRDDEYYG